jgi:NADH-quinone oxidoreductase subunit J
METVVTIVFLIIAALMLFSGVMVVAVKNIIHSALWLISTFFMVGALYLLLEAEFLAVVQVLIYVGAVSILMLFAIMLTRHVMASRPEQAFYRRWYLALGVCLLLFGAAIVPTLLAQQPGFAQATETAQQALGSPERIAGVFSLGVAYVSQYLIPFQIAGLLLLVALIGAIVIAFEERSRRRRILTLAQEHELRRRQAQPLPPAEPVVMAEESNP